MQTKRRRLSTAEGRRDTVLRTAIGAFAARRYFGNTTTEVAKAAGIVAMGAQEVDAPWTRTLAAGVTHY
ncbi:MAG TPA: hypothetical protein VFF37_00970 [Streptomyces sp.]|nr:hypothetical protein [Streptomyces sp.]